MDSSYDLMTPEQVAEVFQVQIRTVQKWVREGRLKGVRTPTNGIRIRREDLEALLAEADD